VTLAQEVELHGEHQSHVRCVALCDDVLVASYFAEMTGVWTVAGRREIDHLGGDTQGGFDEDSTGGDGKHTSEVTAAAVQPTVIFTGSDDQTARVWELDGNSVRCRHTFTHPGEVTAVALEGDTAATGCRDGSVRTYSVATGEQIREFKGDDISISSLLLCGSILLAGGMGEISVWVLHEGATSLPLGPQEMLKLGYHPGRTSDMSGEQIVGNRYNKTGTQEDLNEDEFLQLDADDQKLYTKIAPVAYHKPARATCVSKLTGAHCGKSMGSQREVGGLVFSPKEGFIMSIDASQHQNVGQAVIWK
jgi:WD40 repeat protein